MVQLTSLSVNKVAEYIVSQGARQRRILSDRKYPDPDFKMGMYYKEATEAVCEYVAGGCIDPTPLNKQSQILNQITTDKVGTARRINSNIDAIERFSGMLDDIDLLDAEPKLGAHSAPKITVHNVPISVRPEIILRGTGPKGKEFVGAIKLHFSKTHPHSEQSAGYVSAILQEYCNAHLVDGNEVVNPLYCQVFDIASGTVFPGVKATIQRMKDIQADCQNIVALWPSI